MFKISFTSEVLCGDAVCFFVFSHIAGYVTEDKSTKCVQESAYEVKIMGTFTYKIILNTYLNPNKF